MKAFFTIAVFVTLLFGCSSGKKALEKGDYDKAFYQAIKRLRSNDDHKKSRNTLKKAYPLALELHQSYIKRAQISAHPLKWETVSANYKQINGMYDEVLRCPACREVVPNPKRFDTELVKANQKAAETRYELGMEALRYKHEREKAIEAHQHFLTAQNFVPRFRDLEEKIQEAFFHATLKVVVEPIPAPAKVFNIRHEFFVNKINEYLHSHRINDYVRFYTPEEAVAEKLEHADHIIRMEFDRFTLGNVSSHTTEREVTRDSVEIGEKEGEKIYGTVKAALKINEKSVTGSGTLDFKIMDNSLQKVISQEKFPSEYTWFVRWATYNGDERALSEEELKMVKTVEANIPRPQLMFEEFTAPLYDQVIRQLRDYYRFY